MANDILPDGVCGRIFAACPSLKKATSEQFAESLAVRWSGFVQAQALRQNSFSAGTLAGKVLMRDKAALWWVKG